MTSSKTRIDFDSSVAALPGGGLSKISFESCRVTEGRQVIEHKRLAGQRRHERSRFGGPKEQSRSRRTSSDRRTPWVSVFEMQRLPGWTQRVDGRAPPAPPRAKRRG